MLCENISQLSLGQDEIIQLIDHLLPFLDQYSQNQQTNISGTENEINKKWEDEKDLRVNLMILLGLG